MRGVINYKCFVFFAVVIVIASCKKSDSSDFPPPPPDNTTIKESTSFTTGVAINYNLMKNNLTYSKVVKEHFDRLTFEYQMKHAANVQNNGMYNFTNSDELVSIAQAAGLEVYGHTLVWHQNNNGNYLRSLTSSGSALNPVLVKNAMQDWITTAVTRYKGKIKAWDVVNEVVDETGNFRTGTSTNDAFYWYSVLGSSYIADAFNYAHAADPAAVLFINDYNLESSPAKLSATVALVNQLKAAAVPLHGIATQMHISINTPDTNIDNMFAQLAATGLQVHVSELDVRINPGNVSPFTITPALLEQQAQKYKYVAQSYRNNVPVAQRYGITVWNVTDADSWIVTSMGQNDFPCLFDAGYNKKPAFNLFVSGLKL